MRSRVLAATMLAGLLISGCGKEGKVRTADKETTGSVTLGGAPAANIRIVLYPTGDGKTEYLDLGDDGKFKTTMASGTYNVVVEKKPNTKSVRSEWREEEKKITEAFAKVPESWHKISKDHQVKIEAGKEATIAIN